MPTPLRLALPLVALLAAAASAQPPAAARHDTLTPFGRELAKLRDEDQADRSWLTPADFPRVPEWAMAALDAALRRRDAERRVRVREFVRRDRPRTAAEYVDAALILQHGEKPDDYRQAHEWAAAARELDSTYAPARSLFAQSWDRYQLSLKKPQWYGASVGRLPDGTAALDSIDTTRVTDAERKRLLGYTLAERRAEVADRNARMAARRAQRAPSATPPSSLPRHVDAVDGILAALDSVPLVAILEEHMLAEEGELYLRLLRDPRAPGKIDDVILELGNQLFQPLADRYVGWKAGPPVPRDSAFMMLHDNTQAGLVTMYAPMYQATLDAVRDANVKAPPGRRMRVLLGDPPVDWRTITRDQLWEAHKRRGELMRELARDSVVARGRRGVLLAGGSHLIRRPGPDGRDAKWGALAGKVFVVEVHTGFGAPLARLEPTIDSLRRFAMLRTADPFLRDVRYDDVKAATPGPDGAAPAAEAPPAGMRSAAEGLRLRDMADAYVYLGPFRRLTTSAPELSRLREPARLAELQRRTCMVLGHAADTTRLFRAPPALYFPDGRRPSRVDWEPVGAPPRDERAGPPPLPAVLPEPCASLLARGGR